MRIVWDNDAKVYLKEVLAYCNDTFGQHVAQQFLDRLATLEQQLTTNPERGFPEALLANRGCTYRSIVVQKHFKLVYRIMEEETIHIVDLWDTRREPKKLTKRIK